MEAIEGGTYLIISKKGGWLGAVDFLAADAFFVAGIVAESLTVI